jgi:hypothetical protein
MNYRHHGTWLLSLVLPPWLLSLVLRYEFQGVRRKFLEGGPSLYDRHEGGAYRRPAAALAAHQRASNRSSTLRTAQAGHRPPRGVWMPCAVNSTIWRSDRPRLRIGPDDRLQLGSEGLRLALADCAHRGGDRAHALAAPSGANFTYISHCHV